MHTLADAISMRDLYSDKYDALIAEYGTGVRPSWVSAELSVLGANFRRWKAEAERLSEAA